ncbi:Peptidyl-prolyl cis-trans isomerase CYP59 [Vitis vinifera]|uniref:Peptidyl-prolyl cis-trans isomerase n=1 Tax=Vitis vinifera TaxID=29760 RepID=A0A438CNA9_VITVI|nr:Peptidyl-prolyl cis-trans isomerase CYP59 [Vitis vinifera]
MHHKAKDGRFSVKSLYRFWIRKDVKIFLQHHLEFFGASKVNLEKSTLFGINVDLDQLARMALVLDCKVLECLFLTWDFHWGISKAGGRITLIYSCLSHTPSYFPSMFKIPSLVALKIEKLQRDFLWSGFEEHAKDNLVSSLASGYPKHLWDTYQWVGCEHCSWVVTSLSLEGHCIGLSKFFQIHSDGDGRWVKNSVLGRIVVRVSTFVLLIPRLFSLAHMDWDPSRTICDMMIISYGGLRNSSRGKGILAELAKQQRVSLLSMGFAVVPFERAFTLLCDGTSVDDDVRLEDDWVPLDEQLDTSELEELIRSKEAHSRAVVLESIGDIPDAEIKPPDNVLFVCKLNPVTEVSASSLIIAFIGMPSMAIALKILLPSILISKIRCEDEDLHTIFSRFGTVISAEIIRDFKTGDSLCYAFIEIEMQIETDVGRICWTLLVTFLPEVIEVLEVEDVFLAPRKTWTMGVEFETNEACEQAYFKHGIELRTSSFPIPIPYCLSQALEALCTGILLVTAVFYSSHAAET